MQITGDNYSVNLKELKTTEPKLKTTKLDIIETMCIITAPHSHIVLDL